MPCKVRIAILSVALSMSLSSMALSSMAQQSPSPLAPYIEEDAPALVLEHVRVIDGAGSAPQEDMRVDIAGGKIIAVQSVLPSSSNPSPAWWVCSKGAHLCRRNPRTR